MKKVLLALLLASVVQLPAVTVAGRGWSCGAKSRQNLQQNSCRKKDAIRHLRCYRHSVESLKPPPSPPMSPPVVPNAATRIYPCEGSGVVKLEKIMPNQVQTGTEFEYKIKVTNLADYALADVIVTDTLISNFQHKTSTPQANIEGNKLIWVFPSLGPKETKEIVGIGVAAAGGIVQSCTDVTYRMPVCLQVVSVQPNIVVTKTAPAEVSICDPINYIIKVENTGTGPANNVKVIDELPNGLVTTQGNSRIEMPLGTLPAGTARNILVAVKAQKSRHIYQ